MSYGVDKWASPNTRARPAAKRKKSARRTGKKSSRASAPHAKKKKRASAPKPKARKPRAAKKRAAKKPKAKKAKLYTRYDPETGQKVRVTNDTFEYAEWPSRKPTKKKLQRESLKRDPIGTSAQVITEAVKKSAARTVERETGKVARRVGGSAAVGAGATAARASAAAIAPAVGAAAVIGAALYAMGRIGELRNVAAGERANKISREFVAAQQNVMKQFGVSRWDDVPADLRTKLVNGYKKKISEVYSTTVPLAGTIRPSQSLPYGR